MGDQIDSYDPETLDPDSDEAKGARLERAIRTAMLKQGGEQTVMGLCAAARINRNTIYEWFTGKAVPSARALGRVAKIIEVPIRDLWDAYEGRPTTPASVEEAIYALIRRMDANAEQQERDSTRIASLESEVRRVSAVVKVAAAQGVVRALEEAGEPPGTKPPRRRRKAPPPTSE